MKKLDYRHLTFHILIALYFIWFTVFAILLVSALSNVVQIAGMQLGSIFLQLILFNLIMGTALYIVIKMFREKGLLTKLVHYSYMVLAVGSLVTVFIIRARA